MLVRTVLGMIFMMFVMVQAGNAESKEDLQKYFNDTASKVKATDDPVQKRDILNKSLQTMSKALDQVQNSPLISQDDLPGLEHFKAALQENQDELAGLNGYDGVSDGQLNAFSDYVVQNMEQAEKTITIGVVTALLIVIIIILIS
jgi:hypothetical protein